MAGDDAGAGMVVCVESNASFKGGAARAASRLVQQLEPTWQTVWGHKAEERHIRPLQLSSREAAALELQASLRPRVIVCLLLW